MRYRKLAECGTRVRYRYVFNPNIPSVSDQLANTLKDRFPLGAGHYRLVGHSLGSQVVIHTATLLSRAKKTEVEATGRASFM